MDFDVRLLRYFAAIAAEGTLTGAAARLYVSQPALTKQVKQLEQILDVQLFARSRNGMTLTVAGQALADRVPALLAHWQQTLHETKEAAARADRVLGVGIVANAAGDATPRIVADFSRRNPGWRVDMRQASWSNPSAGVASGEVDVALVRLPFPEQDSLRVRVLFTEPRCVALPATHRLATRDAIRFEELWDEPFVAAPAETGPWRDYWLGTAERAGHAPLIGAVTDLPDSWLSAIANGYGVALAPESAARYYARPGVVYRPVTAVGPSQVAVVWAPAADHDVIVQEFVRSCVENVPGRLSAGVRDDKSELSRIPETE